MFGVGRICGNDAGVEVGELFLKYPGVVDGSVADVYAGLVQPYEHVFLDFGRVTSAVADDGDVFYRLYSGADASETRLAVLLKPFEAGGRGQKMRPRRRLFSRDSPC